MWVLSIAGSTAALYLIHISHAWIFSVRAHESRIRRWLLICIAALVIALLSSGLELVCGLLREPAHEWLVVLAGLGYMGGLCITDTIRARRDVIGSVPTREED